MCGFVKKRLYLHVEKDNIATAWILSYTLKISSHNPMKDLEKKLLNRDIKPTASRLLIFKAMSEFDRAFSLADLETELQTVNKSTIFRTLALFHENLLIHNIDDGSGSMKYSICSDSCTCSLGDMHVHFTCNRCQNTYCLESISIPSIQLPEKFLLESVNFVMKGLCDQCSKSFKSR